MILKKILCLVYDVAEKENRENLIGHRGIDTGRLLGRREGSQKTPLTVLERRCSVCVAAATALAQCLMRMGREAACSY